MVKLVENILESVDALLAWLSTSVKQTAESYCDLQTADSPHVLVSHDGALVSVLHIRGVKALVGKEEFNRIQAGLLQSLQTSMSRPGYSIQVHFNYNKDGIRDELTDILQPSHETAKRLSLSLEDLFVEQVEYLANYCAQESIYLVLWTRPLTLTSEQTSRANKDKAHALKELKVPPFVHTQNVVAAIPDLRDAHDSFVRSLNNDMNMLGMATSILNVHDAIYAMRCTVDPDFTDREWRPVLPGDMVTPKLMKVASEDISDLLWPSLGRQLMPRDAENLDLRTVKIGDRIYSSIFIDLFM